MIKKNPNYITPMGHKKLVDELNELVLTQRPKITKVIQWAASNGDRSENADYIYGKKRLREIDKRSNFLRKRIEAAIIVDPKSIKSNEIKFGATVSLESETGEEKTFIIVGVDEINLTKGFISWKSPIGKALLGKSIGDVIEVKTPNGLSEYEVLNIKYIDIY